MHRMLGQSQSIAISKTTNPRWTAPEVIRDFVLGPAGDGEIGWHCFQRGAYDVLHPQKHLPSMNGT
eukprot:1140240-Pelagomonas_calceolata.AAC.6